MATAYSVYVHEHITTDGLLITASEGEISSASGIPVVLLQGGRVVSASGFFESKSKAMREAADRAESIGLRIIEQARRLRESADESDASGTKFASS